MNAKLKREARCKIILHGYLNNEPLKDIATKIGCSLASLRVSASKLGCTRTPTEAAEFPRDFHMPEHKREDYKQLMISGRYKSRDCAQILGHFE
ncbi:hypothetical protein [Mesorhizobium sp. M0408]|uniref:hypothetical protein n=1 Tax=Mesorhizobium sp. M0408 TaxID=2956942 RepID=UPI0033398003